MFYSLPLQTLTPCFVFFVATNLLQWPYNISVIVAKLKPSLVYIKAQVFSLLSQDVNTVKVEIYCLYIQKCLYTTHVVQQTRKMAFDLPF